MAGLRVLRSRVLLGIVLASVGLGVSALAGEPRRLIDASRVLDAGVPSAPDVAITRTPPDPAPLVERGQWIFDLRWDSGDVWLLGQRKVELAAPQPTPRVMGRFALELYEGPAMIERVRFDFPLLGPPEPLDAGWNALPPITRKLRTRVGVFFPATLRGTRLYLVDRATQRRWALVWPPAEAAASGVTPQDGGAPDSDLGRAPAGG